MPLPRLVLALLLPIGLLSCAGGGPASPSPVISTPARPNVLLEVSEATCCNRSTVSSSDVPTINYPVCRSLSISGDGSITYTQHLTVFGADGIPYFTRAFGGEETLTSGFVLVGCTGGVVDHDLSRTGDSYTYRVEYRTDSGAVGFAEGTAPYKQLTPFRTGIVISQFRSRGPNGAEDQFVELTNVSASPVDIDDWSLQGSSSASSVGLQNDLAGVVLPGCSVLMISNSTVRFDVPVYSGIVRGDIYMRPRLNDTIGIAVRTRSGQIVDQVAMSENTVFREGTPLEPFGPANTDRAYVRIADTGDNRRDFQMRSPSAPRNRSMCNATTLASSSGLRY
jgi:hypothetical protein